MEKGLIIKEKWANLILDGEKTLELRGSNTKTRGTIGIIKSSTGKVWGEVDLIDSFLLDEESFNNLRDKHKVEIPFCEVKYKKTYAWVLENPKKYDEPIPYKHKLGCVKWVNLKE